MWYKFTCPEHGEQIRFRTATKCMFCNKKLIRGEPVEHDSEVVENEKPIDYTQPFREE